MTIVSRNPASNDISNPASNDSSKPGASGDEENPDETDTTNYNKLRKEFFDEISKIKENIHLDIQSSIGSQKQLSKTTTL